MSLHRSNPYSLEKRCVKCGIHIKNRSKILLCENCRMPITIENAAQAGAQLYRNATEAKQN